MLRKIVLWSVIVIVAIGVLFFAGMLLLAITGKPEKVSDSQMNICLHSDYETIMSKVIKARTKNNGDWKSFSDAQDAAERAHMLIEPGRITLSGHIWMVPFTQQIDNAGTKQYLGLLDCSTDNVEMSGG